MRSSRARFSETPAQIGREIGRYYGRAILDSLEQLRVCFRRHGAASASGSATRTWFDGLPERHQQELQGGVERGLTQDQSSFRFTSGDGNGREHPAVTLTEDDGGIRPTERPDPGRPIAAARAEGSWP